MDLFIEYPFINTFQTSDQAAGAKSNFNVKYRIFDPNTMQIKQTYKAEQKSIGILAFCCRPGYSEKAEKNKAGRFLEEVMRNRGKEIT